jgi:hypothetical protein
MVFSMGCRVIKFKGTLSRQGGGGGVRASEIISRSGQVGYGDGRQCHENVIFLRFKPFYQYFLFMC